MPKVSFLINKDVIDLEKHIKIGQVEDVILLYSELKILALKVRLKGIFKGYRFLLFKDIYSMSSQKVRIESRTKLIKPYKALSVREALVNEKKIFGAKVVDSSGEELGRVKELYFNSSSAQILKIEIKQGLLKQVSTGNIFIQIEAIEDIKTGKVVLKENYNNFVEIRESSSGEKIKKATKKAAEFKVRTEVSIQEKERLFCLNKKAGQKILGDRGNIIAQKGQLIDDEVIEKAIEAGKLHELTLSIGKDHLFSTWENVKKGVTGKD